MPHSSKEGSQHPWESFKSEKNAQRHRDQRYRVHKDHNQKTIRYIINPHITIQYDMIQYNTNQTQKFMKWKGS